MRMPPYGRTVARTSQGYWDRGTRVLVFAGPMAWEWCGRWLDVDANQIMQARHRYTLILPTDAPPDALRWPVSAKPVVVVMCGGDADQLGPLISTLQRDGCAGGEVVDIEDVRGCVLGFDHALRSLQPWAWAVWDAEVMREAAAARAQSNPVLRLLDDDHKRQRLRGLLGDLLAECRWPDGSLGHLLAAQLTARDSATVH